MKSGLINLVLVYCLFVSTSTAQNRPAQSPYNAETQRTIKALSEEEFDGYLYGRGMGMAKAAELNHYPGPKHVLDLDKTLNLTPQQRYTINEIYKSMLGEAKQGGITLIELEAELDSLFVKNVATDEKVLYFVERIAKLQGALRYVHLKAHIATKAQLTPEQIILYDRLRGYLAPPPPAVRRSGNKK